MVYEVRVALRPEWAVLLKRGDDSFTCLVGRGEIQLDLV